MTGLEKIIKQIESDAEAQAMTILRQAKAEAEEILEKAHADAECQRKSILEEGETAYRNLKAMSESVDHLESRKAMLLLKQKLIQETIGQARETLYGMDMTEYFGVLKKLIFRYALPGEGEIALNAEDLRRKPKTFEQEINAELAGKGGSLTISTKPRSIDGGFVLIYGGVEENCSFTALFESVQEHLQDKVQDVLFAAD